MNTREIVLELLLELEKNSEYENLLLRSVLDKYDYLDPRDKAFIKRLAEGVIERRIQLDYYLDQISQTPVKKMKPVIRQIMRMGAYQILFMDSVPDSAACNESVKLANRKHFQNLKGFVNGVLRNLSRQRENLRLPDPEKERKRYLSVRYSMPEWILELWEKQYGKDQTEEICRGLMQERPLVLRMNRRLGQEEMLACVREIEDCGCRINQNQLLPYAWEVRGSEGITALPGFYEGRFSAQDTSSMMVTACTEKLGLYDREKPVLVVDVCAAPGGKAAHTAELLGRKGCVIARDLTEKKVDLILENRDRLGLDNLKAEVHDALLKDQELLGKADLVIADLPCSGLGIIGRKGDIKYRVAKEDLKELAALQRSILDVVSEYVKPGGYLLYSTCTVNREENQENASYIADFAGFEPVDLSEMLPTGLQEKSDMTGGYCQMYPGELTDGFFLSCFVKRNTI